MSKIEIFKLQLSIMTGHAKRQMLIYNKDRSIILESDATDDATKLMGNKLKSFFSGFVDDNKKIVISKEVPDPGW